VLALIGSKEGIAHSPLAFINPGDLALIPDPAYPVYRTSVQFAGGVPYVMPLLRERGFLPDLFAIGRDVARSAKLIFLNYPNNPTGGSADEQFFKELVDFASDNEIIVMHDNPYSEVYFGDSRSRSILQTPGAKEVAVEFHSLSKTYNMAGWRVGAVVGNAEIVAGIGKIKSNIDSGNFGAVQDAGIAAMNTQDSVVEAMRREYRRRIEVLYPALIEAGMELSRPKATFYLWAYIGGDSLAYSKRLLEETGIVATPGIGFGEYGEGFIRFSVTQPYDRIQQAAERLQGMKAGRG
jgi:LL-diaminopimelate aminotransferase